MCGLDSDKMRLRESVTYVCIQDGNVSHSVSAGRLQNSNSNTAVRERELPWILKQHNGQHNTFVGWLAGWLVVSAVGFLL